MRMRSIFAKDMQEAIAIARRDMGEDAIMLQSERPKTGQGLVVTFGIEERDEFEMADAAPMEFSRGTNTAAVVPPPVAGRSGGGLQAAPPVSSKAPLPTSPLRGEEAIRGLAAAAKPIPKPAPRTAAPKPVEALTLLTKALEWHGIPATTVSALTNAARDARVRTSTNPVDTAESLLTEAVASSCKFKPITAEKTDRAIMLVGMPGVGKTTAIAKIATDAIKRGQSLRVITTDTSRAAAYDQLAAFTEILGISLSLAENRNTLRDQLRDVPAGVLTLIDTAGCNPYDFQELKQLGEIAKLQDVEPVLVLPLGIDVSEAQEISSVFTFLDIERLLITRADCARRFGGIFTSIQAGGFAFANVSASLNVADGCPPLDATRLAHYLIRPLREKLQ